MALWHGSADGLEIGTVLRARPNAYAARADAELESLFEAARPDGLLPRARAVFMVDDPDEIDAAGGYDDNIYEVEPIGGWSRHDLAWYSEAQAALSDGDAERAAACADAYWSGNAFPEASHSLFETLAEAACVVAPESGPAFGR